MFTITPTLGYCMHDFQTQIRHSECIEYVQTKGIFMPHLFWMELAAACMAAAAASCALRFMLPGGGHIPVPT